MWEIVCVWIPISNICNRLILGAHEGNGENIMTKLFSLWDLGRNFERGIDWERNCDRQRDRED